MTDDRLQRQGSLKTLIFECTQRCNLQCSYCYNIWKLDGIEPLPDLGTWRTIRILRRAIKQTGCTHLAFSGGEPFLRDDLVELVAAVKLMGVKVNVLTNGALIDDAWIKDLQRVGGVDLYQITLLGMDPAIHDAHCGRGHHAKAIAAIDRIRRLGSHAAVSFVLTKRNVGEVDAICKYVKEIGQKTFLFNRFNPGGEGTRHIEELMPSRQELETALRAADAAAVKYGVHPFCATTIPPCVIDPADYPHLGFPGCAAATANSYCTVDPQGNLRMCNHTPTILGNVRKDHALDLAASKPVHDFVLAVPDFCQGCEHWSTCLGGCRAASEQTYGSSRACDPFVQACRGGPERR